MLLEIGKEFIYGDVDEALLAEAEEDAAEALIEEAMAMGKDQAALPL